MDVEQIHPHLKHRIDRRLKAVYYHCLKFEATVEDLLDPKFYFGGEVELRFSGVPPLFIAANQSDKWSTWYTVAVSQSSLFFPDTLEMFDATNTPVWQRYLSQPLAEVALLGWDGECHIVRASFPTGAVLIGCSRMASHFGGGDDIAVRTHDQAFSQMRLMGSVEEQWSTRRAQ